MRYFGLEEGIPIVDHSLTPNENFMARSSAGEVYDWMLTELDRAIAIEDLPLSTMIAVRLKWTVRLLML